MRLLELIEKKTERRGDCLVWTGATAGKARLPLAILDGQRYMVHRFLFEEGGGDLSGGARIRQTCTTDRCVVHWELKRAPKPPRTEGPTGAAAANAQKTHCPEGHPYDKKNTKISKRGTRICKTCQRAKSVQRRLDAGMKPRQRYASAEEALLVNSVEMPNGCRIWTGKKDRRGYGWVSLGGTRYGAHRLAYKTWIGPLEADKEIDHRCHSEDLSCTLGDDCPHRACIAKDHLEQVPHQTNMLRGRTFANSNTAKEACPQGHPYDEENTYVDPDGGRHCRTCRRAQNRAWYQRNKTDQTAATDLETAA